MIDWLTLHLDIDAQLLTDYVTGAAFDSAFIGPLTPSQAADLRLWSMLYGSANRIQTIAPDGEVIADFSSWSSLRSDHWGLAYHASPTGLTISGSPARVVGNGCNIFGSDDIVFCASAMIEFFVMRVAAEHDLVLDYPLDVSRWRCSRIDITYNFLLDSLTSVDSALSFLRGLEGGKYRLTPRKGDTVYWSKGSRHRSAKAYSKGRHQRYAQKRNKGVGVAYSELELLYIDRLLRLELQINSRIINKLDCQWHDLTPDDLYQLWGDFFIPMFDDKNLPVTDKDRFDYFLSESENLGYSSSQARQAWATYLLIKEQGYHIVKDTLPKSTFYRHRKILKDCGFGEGDLSSNSHNVVRFKKSIDIGSPITSFDELYSCF